jgi:hypothetical protein
MAPSGAHDQTDGRARSLTNASHEIALAFDLLDTFSGLQVRHMAHRDRILKELARLEPERMNFRPADLDPDLLRRSAGPSPRVPAHAFRPIFVVNISRSSQTIPPTVRAFVVD